MCRNYIEQRLVEPMSSLTFAFVIYFYGINTFRWTVVVVNEHRRTLLRICKMGDQLGFFFRPLLSTLYGLFSRVRRLLVRFGVVAFELSRRFCAITNRYQSLWLQTVDWGTFYGKYRSSCFARLPHTCSSLLFWKAFLGFSEHTQLYSFELEISICCRETCVYKWRFEVFLENLSVSFCQRFS